MIKRNFKSVLFFYLQITSVWVFAWTVFYVMRRWGLDEFNYVQYTEPPKWQLHLCIHLGVGLLTGILYSTSELIFEKPYFRKRVYGQLIFLKTITYFFIAIILMSFAVITVQKVRFGELIWEKVRFWMTSDNFFVALFHFLIVSILISFIRQMNYKFGPGVLWNMLIGKYHHPREEERIFMFLDLRSSTTIAEKLGHIRFSRFIQDCFYDLTDIVLMHHVDIYQYVGDEAVLSWKLSKGFKNNHCLASYFDFMKVLNNKADYYKNEYGIQPFFKAGIHMGKVTVAEVGVIKKEIAYHGDVLNTAARIQARCNELNQGLLVSQDLLNAIQVHSPFAATEMGKEVLKGKEKEVAIYGIEKIEEKRWEVAN